MAQNSKFRLTKSIIHALLATSVVAVSLLVAILQQFWVELPNIEDSQAFVAQESIRITDRNNFELYRIIGTEDRTWVELGQIPIHVQQAFIAIEDKRFYSRSCLDVRALGRAALANIGNFGTEGGSTITQQLVRTIFLSSEKSIDRKIRELMLACQLERTHNKPEILELYLNWIAFGHGVSGIEQASQLYFSIPVQQLTVAQAAILAALPQRPTYFSPYGPNKYSAVGSKLKKTLRAGTLQSAENIPEDQFAMGLLGRRTRVQKRPFILEGRANEVVRKMKEQGYVVLEDAKKAHNQIVDMQFSERGYRILAPHFVLQVRDEMLKKDVAILQTSLDIRYQQLAEYVVFMHYPAIVEAGARHVALVAVDTATNSIIAYIGNVGFLSAEEGQVDMAMAPRQPGSSFKPFVYAAAFANGHRPNERIVDEPISLGTYKPKNYDEGYLWRMTMSEALAKSRNIPAIKAYYLAGREDPILRLAASLGANHPFITKEKAGRTGEQIQFGWPLALGSAETPLVEMVQAYSTLANGGVHRPLQTVLRAENRNGEQIISTKKEPYQAVSTSIANAITLALSDPANRPEGYWRDAMNVPGVAAAIKTGTSNIALYPRDVWTIGYTSDFMVGVWVGNADGTPLQPEATGLSVALPIWKSFIELASHKN